MPIFEYPPKEQVERITQEVLDFLREKKYYMCSGDCIFPKMLEERKESEEALKKAVEKLLWQDACEGF